ncbi:MAG: hypothetical protein ACLSAH_11830 [Bilophila wadsworthia]
MVFLPVPVDASEIILDAGQLWIEHPAPRRSKTGLWDSYLRTSCAVSFNLVDVRRFKWAIVQLFPLREDGPVQQFGYDAVLERKAA